LIPDKSRKLNVTNASIRNFIILNTFDLSTITLNPEGEFYCSFNQNIGLLGYNKYFYEQLCNCASIGFAIFVISYEIAQYTYYII
jgi:hypothetical protein